MTLSSSVRCGVALLAVLPWMVGALLPGRADGAPGGLDPTFGVGGQVTTTVATPNDVAAGLALRSNGKIVAVGYTNDVPGDFTVAQYDTSGVLDPAFDGDGKLTTDFGASDDAAFGVIVQPVDGMVVVAGASSHGLDQDFALARYTATGGLDPTFGSGGKVTTNFAGSGDDLAFGLVRQSDGKIVVAGVSTAGTTNRFALARYTTAGTLDPTFGSGGTTTTLIGVSSVATSIALQTDGKIVVAGYANIGAGLLDFAVARYLSSGALDLSFGSGGTVVTDFGAGTDFGFALVIQSDGKIVVAGETAHGSTEDFALARYNTNGTLDTTGFGTGGKVTTVFSPGSAVANGLALRSDGTLVAAGLADDGTVARFALAVYDASGVLDPTFGLGGRVTTEFSGADSAQGVGVQSDGKIVLAGQASDTVTSSFGLARYLVAANSCTTSAECNDGLSCTADACVLAVCTHTAIAGTCDDGDVCTTDSCDLVTGCVHTNNNAPCSDGSACTTTDTCSGGLCVGGPAPDCNDGNACTTDSCAPATGCQHVAITCNDANACTTDTCNPASGCVYTPNDVPCSDGNACTTTDTCSGGSCVGGPDRNCDDGNVCTTDACNPLTGCTHTNNSSPCDDGNACTTTDTCSGGTCAAGPALQCNDGNICTNDSCNPSSGCTHASNSFFCTDGNVCTVVDTCSGGSCVPGPDRNCDDANPCTTDACDPVTGCTHTNNSSPCSDGNACTTTDTCSGGTCAAGPALQCNDGNICTNDSCNPSSGCVYVNNGAGCDDSNPCTTNDTCQNGVCTGGPAASCNDLNPCTADTCLPVGGCQHTNIAGSCDDGNPCTTGDTCSGGSCFPGSATDCDDHNGCTDDSCNTATGCVHVDNTASCNDGNVCTTNDTCSAGACAGGPPLTCDDANVCTTDTCNPSTGCGVTNNTAVCDDGDPTTLLDQCAAGVCVSGSIGCAAAPIAGCKRSLVPSKTKLKLKRGSRSSSDRLYWNWKTGAATLKSEFGNPATGTGGFALCLYDAIGGVPQLLIDRGITPGGTCGAASCWQDTSTGFKYKDRFSTVSPGGIQIVTLREGYDGRAQVVVKGRGAALGVPLLPLEQDPALTIQLIGQGGCFQSDFEPPYLNTRTVFSDTASE